jgi:dihydroorotate dehydrogenase electron transfer subunit
MSIAWIEPDRDQVHMIFKVFGRGTRLLSHCSRGDEVELLGPLGVPFKMPKKNDTCLLIGGGVGFPPLYFLARHMIEKGRDPKSIEFFYGGRTSGEIVERTRLRKLGVKFRPVTDDGSFGERGLVTEAVTNYLETTPPRNPRIYSCGPEPMLKAVDDLGRKAGIPGQVSLEAPMPCGFGVCLGCIVPLRAGGNARVCTEGPVFEIGEVKL